MDIQPTRGIPQGGQKEKERKEKKRKVRGFGGQTTATEVTFQNQLE